MAQSIHLDSNLSKTDKYLQLIPQIKSLCDGEDDLIANMANITAVLKSVFNYFWVGFYIVRNNQLILGPFQGDVACTRISFGKGVCGKAWEKSETIIVPDVNQFEGHIACSALSKSEIVVPVIIKNQIIAVLDIDSDKFNDFDKVDKEHLELIVKVLNK